MSKIFRESHLLHARQLYEGGMTLSGIAQVIGFHPNVISKKLRAAGAKIRIAAQGRIPPNRLKLPEAEIIAKYLAGARENALAVEYGVSRLALHNMLVRSGTPMRSQTEVNQAIAAAKTREQHHAGVAAARAQRLFNLRTASHDDTSRNPAVGNGYHLLAEALQQRGFMIERQVPLGPYYLDLVFNGIAVEVEYSQGFHVRSARFKYLAKREQPVIYILFDNLATLTRRLDDIIAFLETARSNPPLGGEYWMIRCYPKPSRKRPGEVGYTKDDKRAAIERPKYSTIPTQWVD